MFAFETVNDLINIMMFVFVLILMETPNINHASAVMKFMVH